ncbi:HIRAN domain-containing protein [Caldicellulosiruptoraceae bacterium PP1]
MNKPRYAAIVGCNHYYGFRIFKPGMKVILTKEPDNEYDDEAIMVSIKDKGKIGYIANSTNTVPRGCYSAGRIYDTFEKSTTAIVKFVTNSCVIVMLKNKKRFDRK